MEASAGPCLLCPNSFCWSLPLGGAMLRPVFDRSWSSSDFRPSAEVFGKNGVLEEQKSPSELAWGFAWCWDAQSITWILINLLSFSSSMKPEILPLLQSPRFLSQEGCIPLPHTADPQALLRWLLLTPYFSLILISSHFTLHHLQSDLSAT